MTEQPNKRIFVKNIRKDGKLTVEYVYPIAGTRLRKIITLDTLKQDQAEGYSIFGQITPYMARVLNPEMQPN